MHLTPFKHRNKAPVTYNPRFGSDLSTLQREMNSLMNNFFDLGEFSSPLNFSSSVYPTIDIKEDENKYLIDADVPGMSDKDINLDVRNNILTISGKVDTETKDENKGYVCVERSHESFSRDIYLASDVDMDSVKAELKNGVLHIEMNKSELAKKNHKKIAIKH
ncbi:Hsp20/alpha crystallin family protein [Bacteriovorax sp. PP10]|uniref:Hsp20/alpha crystallin family protein n=1 Tax=Bacteriovorax antarcticus TaxID=3088717 RepID=A0ABU5VXR2_9BACT|nr:Hsp20/alpha crystallin family protein [Bacteriovorax sp. PP10]MEA9357850.1 Hsp20/alpha crystallin family protein [Bacteriovorax sp. PP10]